MTTTDEEWESHLSWFDSRTYLEAIGAFALDYNALELSLWYLFRTYFEGPDTAREFLFAKLHNRDRVDFLKQLATADPHQDVRDAIGYGLACFDICCENRNLLLHAASIGEAEAALTLYKPLKDVPGQGVVYALPLADLRKAAISTRETELYLSDTLECVKARQAQPDERAPLPDRPQKPRKLSLSRRAKAPPA